MMQWKTIGCIVGLLICTDALAQNENLPLRKGNQFYKEQQFDQSLEEYKKALAQNPASAVAYYNYGNALFRNKQYDEATQSFDNAIANTQDNVLKQKAFYNKGVSFSKQQKLEESIAAYKAAVIMNPADEDARNNLQKALLELKKKNESKEKKDNKDQKDKKQQQKEKPKPQSKLNKKQVEQFLKALQQKEQEVQKKLQNKTRSASQQEKDW